MKHELKALFRTLIYVGAIVLVLAVLTRIGVALDSLSFVALTAMFLVIGIFVLMLCALIASVQRFWSSFFTGEGYMTFSLPATPAQLLIAKLLSALIAMIFGTFVALVAAVIALSGVPMEFWAYLSAEIGDLFDVLGAYLASDPLIIVEAVLLCISALPMTLLFFYLIMSIGQLFTKWRKGLTFVLFIGAYWVISLLDVLFYTPILETITEAGGIHADLWTEIAVNVVLDLAMFFITRFILMHKVNLIV